MTAPTRRQRRTTTGPSRVLRVHDTIARAVPIARLLLCSLPLTTAAPSGLSHRATTSPRRCFEQEFFTRLTIFFPNDFYSARTTHAVQKPRVGVLKARNGPSWYTARLLAPHPSPVFRSVCCRSRQLRHQDSATEQHPIIACVFEQKLCTRVTQFCPTISLALRHPMRQKQYGRGSYGFSASYFDGAFCNLSLPRS